MIDSRIKPLERSAGRPPLTVDTLTLAIGGDARAQQVVVEHAYDFSRRLLLRLVGATAEFDDLHQNVMISVLTKLRGYRLEASFTTWVGSICVNEARGAFRKSKSARTLVYAAEDEGHVAQMLEKAEGESAGPHDLTAARQLLGRCQAALNELSIEQRTAFLLRVVEGFSVKEVATMMHSALSTTRLRLYYGRKRMAKALGRRIDDAESEKPS